MNPGTAIPLLGRQYRALRASWATWALAAIALLFAATSPVTARYLPEILGGIIFGDIVTSAHGKCSFMVW